MKSARSTTHHKPDYTLLAIVFLLTVAGLAILASASSDLGKTQFNNTYYYLEHQLEFGLSLGLLGFVVGYFWYYQHWKKVALPLLLASIVALSLVFTRFGIVLNGTNRWLRLGPISFQPAELVKLVYLIYLAAFFSSAKLKHESDGWKAFVPFAVVSVVIAGLLVAQPATSTVMILLASGAVVYLMSGGKLRYLAAAGALGVLVLAILIYVTPYRLARITGFLHQSANTQGTNYQVNQALIAIGSGGLTGVGYGQSATKSGYLPAAIDDSIFAIVGEEFGFIGAGALAVLFAFFGVRLLWLAARTSDRFGKLLLVGFGTVIPLQAFVNMAAISGVIPLTGVPLPFISYGGTALAVFLTMSGIAANVTRYN
jgi:cell division protein FtsW